MQLIAFVTGIGPIKVSAGCHLQVGIRIKGVREIESPKSICTQVVLIDMSHNLVLPELVGFRVFLETVKPVAVVAFKDILAIAKRSFTKLVAEFFCFFG